MVSPENVIIIRFRRVQLMVFNIYGFLYSLPAILYILYIYSMLYCMPKKQVSKSSILFSFMGFVFIHSRIYYKIEYNRVIHSSNTFYCLFFMCTWLLIGFTFNTESCRQQRNQHFFEGGRAKFDFQGFGWRLQGGQSPF